MKYLIATVVKGQAGEFNNLLSNKLSELKYINFDKNDGKDKVFHATLVRKEVEDIFCEAWEFVNTYECNFTGLFDNICIYKRINNKWELYREFYFNN